MKALVGLTWVGWLACVAGTVAGEQPTERTMVSVPWRSEPVLQELYAPVLGLLERQLGWRVKLVVARDYGEATKRLHKGLADFAVLGPNSYVAAVETDPGLRYLATAKRPGDHYFSVIITHRDLSITSIEDCAGRSIAFTNRDSTSGYLYPRILLHKAGIDPDADLGKVFLLNKHDKVFDAVAQRRVEVGGASITAWGRARARHGDVFKIVARSDPIPRNALVASNHLTEREFHELKNALANAEKDPEFTAEFRSLVGFSVRNDAFYDVVREARKFMEP